MKNHVRTILILVFVLVMLGSCGKKEDPVKEYSITIESSSHGSVSSSADKAEAGTSITLSISPDQGYELDTLAVTSDGKAVTVTSNRFVMPEADVTVAATFKEIPVQTYAIDLADTPNGTVEASAHTSAPGNTITLTITPLSGYQTDTILVTQGSNQIDVTNLRFTMPEGDVTVTVTFVEIPVLSYDITVEETSGGEVLVVNDLTEAIAGTTITLEVHPSLLHRLVEGSLKYHDGTTFHVIDGLSFIMPGSPVTIHALFESIEVPDMTGLVMALLGRPDPWDFLPDSFDLENRVYDGPEQLSYDSFSLVSQIPDTGTGKQLNVLYNIMLEVENVLTVVDPVYDAATAVSNLYHGYVTENPEDYSHYETTYLGIDFEILVLEDGFYINASIGDVLVELFSFEDDIRYYGGRIQFSEANVIKYEFTDDHMVIAARLFGTFRAKVEFIRDADEVLGYLYYFTGVNEIGLNTRALLYSNPTHTTIIGETGDFITGATTKRNVEVYSSITGNMVGGEVKEEVSALKYDTMWYPLNKISGVTNVKILDVENGNNEHTVYINNASTPLEPHTQFLVGSRYYDIEIKTHFFYTYDSTEETYQKIELSIPMFFIQRGYEEDTGYTAMSSRNGVTISNLTTSADQAAISHGYDELLDLYDEIRDSMTPQDVIEYIG